MRHTRGSGARRLLVPAILAALLAAVPAGAATAAQDPVMVKFPPHATILSSTADNTVLSVDVTVRCQGGGSDILDLSIIQGSSVAGASGLVPCTGKDEKTTFLLVSIGTTLTTGPAQIVGQLYGPTVTDQSAPITIK